MSVYSACVILVRTSSFADTQIGILPIRRFVYCPDFLQYQVSDFMSCDVTGIHIHFLSKLSAGQVSLMIHLPGQNLGCPPKLQNFAAFSGRLCRKREQLCGRLCDFSKANFKLDFPFLRINSNSSFVRDACSCKICHLTHWRLHDF